MAKYQDSNIWEEEILIPDVTTPILGGQPTWSGDSMTGGFANVSAAQLADRTRFLKNVVESISSEIGESMIGSNNLSEITDPAIARDNLGLGEVDNTSDMDKPVSTAQQTALDGKVDKVTGKGLSTNDYTTADKNKVDSLVGLPSTVAGDSGKSLVATSTPNSPQWRALTKSDVGLNNVDNTSDVNKPISTATQTALNAKVDNLGGVANGLGYTPTDLGTIAAAGTASINVKTYSLYKMIAGGNITLAFSNFSADGRVEEFELMCGNFGGKTITWPAGYWMKQDGTWASAVSNSGVTWQTSGFDFVLVRRIFGDIFYKVLR